MNIAPDTLLAQAEAALSCWSFIPAVEDQFALPRWLLLAVGSRETNLGLAYTQGKRGDGGHGHGVWQLDSHPQNATPQRLADCARIDGGDVRFAAEMAAKMLRDLSHTFGGDWKAACCAYNAGVGAVMRHRTNPDEATTGRNYGTDVLSRRDFLVRLLPDHPPAPAEETHMALNKPACKILPTPTDRGYYIIAEDGGVFTYGDAEFHGSLGGAPINQPIVDAALTTTGLGYWLLGADGGIFTFGDAPFLGSAA